MYNFYYAALSDGDASLRIRFIGAPIYPQEPIPPNTKSIPFSTLNFIIDGKRIINGKTICRGQAFYIDGNPKEKNTYIDDTDAVLLSFAIDGIHHRKLISDVKINPNSPTTPIKIYNFDEIMNIYNELMDIYPKDAPVDPPQMLTQITAKQYFYRALHCLEDESMLQLDTVRRKLIVDAESYMRTHFHEEISIEDVSVYLSVDRRYLYKLFKKYSGTSPKQYLNNIRISRATELLSDSDLSVSQIAEQVGYKDPLQFSAFFKNQTGLSPKKYRESR